MDRLIETPYDTTETKSTNGCIDRCKNPNHIKDDYVKHQEICDEYKRDEVINEKYWWHTAGIHPKYKD